MAKRRIFIGDIQGCRSELERLLEALRYDRTHDELHPVGDLVNRGPDSLGVLRLLKREQAGGVLGNHDLHLIQRHAGLRAAARRDTLDDVLAADDASELVAWLAQRPFLRRFDDLVLVHAGLHPLWRDPVVELDRADPARPSAAARFAVTVRTCDPAGSLPDADHPAPGPPFRPWYEYYEPERFGQRRVVFGHWAARGLVDEPHALGLDTGCVWGNRLTAWIPEERRLLSVPAERAWAEIG